VLIDTTKSWTVLIGTASHSPGSDLENLPAVRNNLTDLAAALANPSILGLPQDHIATLLDPRETAIVGNAIRSAGAKASGTLLIYYAGHGLPDEDGQLFLALSGTHTQGLPHDALPFQWMKRDIRRGIAATRILILDCCYAGLGHQPTMAGSDPVADQSAITGTWTLFSSAYDTPSLAPPGAKHTAFTGALIDLLNNGIPDGPDELDSETILSALRRHLVGEGFPRPDQRNSDIGYKIAIARNRAHNSRGFAAQRRESEPDVTEGGLVPDVWGSLPYRNKNFTGRSELLGSIRKLLTAPSGASTPLALRGIGGVGKTQVALEYAYRYREFYDVVWWISADEESLVPSSIASLGPRLNLPYGGAGLDESAAVTLDALRVGKPYARWLLIFDHAERPESIRRFLLDGPGHTLITSRDPSWDDVAEAVQVKVFSRAESVDFLSRRVSGIREQDSKALAEALGDLPLALDQAAALQVKTGMPAPEYLSLLKDRTHDVLSQASAYAYPVPVALAWSVSMSELTETVPEAMELLSCFAFFGPEPIPRYVLLAGRNVAAEPLGRILRDPILFNKALSSLNTYSLVTIEAHGAIQVHRLIQALTREALSSPDRERFRHEVHLMLAAATPRDPDDSTTWPRFTELVRHYGPANMIACHHSDVRLSVRSVIRYQYMAGNFRAALELSDSSLEQWSRDSNAAPTDLLTVKRHRGTVLRALGRYRDAFDVNAAAMAEARETLGPEHDETLRVTVSHGADMRAAGDFRGAYALDEDSVNRHIAVFGNRDTRTLRTKSNFALDMALMGELKLAQQLHDEVYHLGQDVYGSENHPAVLLVLSHLTRDACLCGEYSNAYFLAENNYAACRNNLGLIHPTSLRAATDLVVAERLKVGGSEQAVERAIDVLDQHTKRHGRSHPATLSAATALINAWREAGNLDNAIPLAEEVTPLFREAYGPDHPFWYACRGNLALVLRLGGDVSRARELHETSMDRLSVLLGADHYYTLMCAAGLANDLSAIGDLPAAQSRAQDTLARIRKVLWPDHPMTLACMINLALDLRVMGREDDADKLRSEALARYGHALGSDHPRTQAAIEGQRLDIDFDMLTV
jgi:Tetratricopeptide repeat/Caspase domain